VARAARQRGDAILILDEAGPDQVKKRDVLKAATDEQFEIRFNFDPRQDLLPDADELILNPAVPLRHPIHEIARAREIKVIGEIEYAGRISKAPIIALTGTNGKSTTTVMTYLCLLACGEKPVLCGNIYGSGYPEQALTEAALSAESDQVLVAEISSAQLELTEHFHPVSAGITNITPDHQDRYRDLEEYSGFKHRIFAAQGGRDFAVVKANDPAVRAPGQVSLQYRGRGRRSSLGANPVREVSKTLTFGAHGEHAEVGPDTLTVLNQTIKLSDLPFQEPHNFTNAAMACLLAFGYLKWRAEAEPTSNAARLLAKAKAEYREGHRVVRGMSVPNVDVAPRELFDGLRAFRGLAHRMEPLGSKGGVSVINNSMCTNPIAVVTSAQGLRDPVHLLIGGVNKGLDFQPLRNYLANGRNSAYVFGSDAEQLRKMLGEQYPTFLHMSEAFAAATKIARAGEYIMLSPGCASTDQFEDFVDRGDVFKRIAKEWLES
jgi:UDP-N-acetylmuramoylalanine--D-glutamate ligase